jgi:MscS family membrane protein
MSVVDLGLALLVTILAFGAARAAQVVLGKVQLRTPVATLRYCVVDALAGPLTWALRLGGLWIALTTLPLRSVEAFDLQHFVNSLYQASTIGLGTWLGVRLVSNLAELWARRAADTEGTFDDQLVPIVRSAARVFMIITGVVMILQNLGYSVGSLLAGLGIGGAAVAFASKDAIANVFGSLVIFIDRPFQVGDWVEIGGVEGTVQSVRIRVTEIRTFANSVVTVPNSQMTTTPINNWSRMEKRRVKFDLRLALDTPPDRIEQAVTGIREIIAADARFDQSFALVSLNEVSDWSIDLLVYAFTSTTAWLAYMDTRQDFILTVMKLLARLEVKLAVPVRMIEVHGGTGPGLPPGLRRTA